MAGRNSRKRTAPARLREELWYLVKYEDDDNLRVLGQDDIRHICSDDEDDFQVGDIISAMWLPNSQYYEAQVLQIGTDKNELMKERMKLEKTKRNCEKMTSERAKGPEVQQKRKNHKDGAGRKKKKKSDNETQNDIQEDQKVQERKEKKKKKEEEQRRQNLLQEARKKQAAERWSSTSQDLDVTIVTPQSAPNFVAVPIHRGNSSSTQLPSTCSSPPSHAAQQTNQLSAHSPMTAQGTTPTQRTIPTQHTIPTQRTTPAQRTTPNQLTTPTQRTTPAQRTTPSQRTSPTQLTTPAQRTTPGQHTSPTQLTTPVQRTTPTQHTTPAQQTTSAQRTNETPAGRKQAATSRPGRLSKQSKSTSGPERGIHLQTVDSDSSEDEVSEEDEDVSSMAINGGSGGSCCREQRIEIDALRKRLAKVYKRLNIALKAKTVEEVIKNRPAAGVLDRALAEEHKMIEVMEGAGVYWYSHQRAYCSAFKSWQGYINAAIDIFFRKETLSASSAMGNEKKSKNGAGHQPLNPVIIQALIGKVCSKYSKDGPTPSQVVQKINMKCVEARRPPRSRGIAMAQ